MISVIIPAKNHAANFFPTKFDHQLKTIFPTPVSQIKVLVIVIFATVMYVLVCEFVEMKVMIIFIHTKCRQCDK